MQPDQTGRRTDDLVSYIVDRMSGRVGRTMVVKLLYLIDLEAHRYLGRSVTGVTYRLWHYGPFDPDIYRSLERLRDAGEIAEETIQYPSAAGYRYTTRNPGRTHDLTPAEEAVVTFVLGTYAPRDLEEVLDVVYNTEPMKRVEGEPLQSRIPLECVDDDMRIRLGGISLERALAAEESIREGRTVPWASLRLELLDRGRRAGSG